MRKKLFINFFTVFLVFLLFLDVVVFGVLNNNVNDSYNTQYDEVSKQIVTGYNNYFATVLDTSNTVVSLLRSKENGGPNQISNVFEFTSDVKSDIIGMSLYTSGYNVFSQSNLAHTLDSSDRYYLFDKTNGDSTMYIFSKLYSDNFTPRVCLVRKVVYYDQNGLKQSGIIVIEMNFEQVIDIAENLNLGEKGYLSILDGDGKRIYSNSNIDIEPNQEIIDELVIGTTSIRNDGNLLYVKISSLEKTPWKIAIFANASGLEKTHNTLLIYLFITTVLGLIIAFIIINRVSKQLTKPLLDLENHMLEIDDNYHLKIIKNKYEVPEIESLTKSFNTMIYRINELMEEVVEKSNSQRMSELKSLQNQINPHFLYNTLDSIIYLTESEDNEKSIEMTVALARLFRISISRGKFIIPIKNEIEHARSYLIIQSIRYRDAFKYNFEIDHNIYKYKTMKLILQPLIENAIYHGLKNKIDEGLILIKGYIEEDFVIFEVSDNGYGITEDKINDLYKTFNNPDLNDGVGVKNVYQRLKLYFGNRADLKIISVLDEGTTIRLQIPIKEELEND